MGNFNLNIFIKYFAHIKFTVTFVLPNGKRIKNLLKGTSAKAEVVYFEIV